MHKGSMRLRSKLFLVLSILLWAIEYTPFGSKTLHGIPLPLAAVFFGLFLITWVFPRRDFDQFEKDQALRNQLIRDERRKRRRPPSMARPSRDRIDATERDWDPSPKQMSRLRGRRHPVASSRHR